VKRAVKRPPEGGRYEFNGKEAQTLRPRLGQARVSVLPDAKIKGAPRNNALGLWPKRDVSLL
jgi:hypothetical protein